LPSCFLIGYPSDACSGAKGSDLLGVEHPPNNIPILAFLELRETMYQCEELVLVEPLEHVVHMHHLHKIETLEIIGEVINQKK
jgi:hypothetical protein